MLLKVIILVCAAGTSHAACNERVALRTIVAPEPQQGAAMCGLYGEEYLAGTALLHEGERVKVLCRPIVRPPNVG